MTEVVVAVYKSASAAEIATADLEVARVPTATIRQFVSDPAADEQLLEVGSRRTTSGDRIVAVTVDERHASTVVEILDMQAPAMMTEAPLALVGSAAIGQQRQAAGVMPRCTRVPHRRLAGRRH